MKWMLLVVVLGCGGSQQPMTTWGEEMAAAQHKQPRMTDEEVQTAQALAGEMGKCVTRLLSPPAPSP